MSFTYLIFYDQVIHQICLLKKKNIAQFLISFQ